MSLLCLSKGLAWFQICINLHIGNHVLILHASKERETLKVYTVVTICRCYVKGGCLWCNHIFKLCLRWASSATSILVSFQQEVVACAQSQQNYGLCFEGQMNENGGTRQCRSLSDGRTWNSKLLRLWRSKNWLSPHDNAPCTSVCACTRGIAKTTGRPFATPSTLTWSRTMLLFSFTFPASKKSYVGVECSRPRRSSLPKENPYGTFLSMLYQRWQMCIL